MTVPAATATEDRALSLLGSGISAESVASALGVSPSRISQLLSNKDFANQVATLRYENLQQHNLRDSRYDDMEDTLLTKLDKAMNLMFRPGDILKAIQVVNSAKRRGQSAPSDGGINQLNIVSLILPVQVIQKFVTNVNNQVIKTGEQELLTIQSGNLLELTKNKEESKQIQNSQEQAHEQKATELQIAD